MADTSRGRSDVAVDIFRGVVVVMMFAVHARRIQTGHGDGVIERGADASLRLLMFVEPYIAASFLYLVGYSLVLSWSGALTRTGGTERPSLARRWRRRMFRRAAWLYLLSVGLCLPQFGLQWPATFVSSGILAVIAAAIAACASLLTGSGARRLAWPLCALILLVTTALHQAKLGVSGLNAGPGGTFPLLAASLLGMLSAPQLALTFSRARLSVNSSVATPARGGPLGASTLRSPWLVVCLVVGGFEWFSGGIEAPWTDTFISHYRDYGDLAALFWLENGLKLPAKWMSAGFWNHTTLGLLGCMLAIWFTHQLLHALFNPRHSDARGHSHAPGHSDGPERSAIHGRSEGPPAEAKSIIGHRPYVLTALGEHALIAYIAHLIALGLVEMFALAPASSMGTWWLVALLVILSLVLATLVNRLFQRRLKSNSR